MHLSQTLEHHVFWIQSCSARMCKGWGPLLFACFSSILERASCTGAFTSLRSLPDCCSSARQTISCRTLASARRPSSCSVPVKHTAENSCLSASRSHHEVRAIRELCCNRFLHCTKIRDRNSRVLRHLPVGHVISISKAATASPPMQQLALLSCESPAQGPVVALSTRWARGQKARTPSITRAVPSGNFSCQAANKNPAGRLPPCNEKCFKTRHA